MLCQICKVNPASIHIQELVNGERHTLHICTECARKRDLTEEASQNPHLQEMLERLTHVIAGSADLRLSDLFETAPEPKEEAPSITCKFCGLDTKTYLKTGKLGCAACYSAFAPILTKELPLIHHGTVHCGKIPPEPEENWQDPTVSERIGLRRELERLRKGLDESVRREEFELAAELRDKITAIEAALDNKAAIPDAADTSISSGGDKDGQS